MARIRRERQKLRAVLDSMAEGVIISDAHANLVDVNAEALSLLGLDDVEQARRHLKDWPEYELLTLDGETIPLMEWPMARASRGERFRDYVVRVHNRQAGTMRTWSFAGAPVYEDDKIVQTVLAVRDMTGQIEVMAELEAERGRLRTIMRVAPIGISLLDADGAVIEMNPAAGSIWAAEELPRPGALEWRGQYRGVDADTGEPFHASDLPTAGALVGGEAIAGRVLDVERPDGTPGTVSVSAVPVADSDGGLVGIVMITEDITALRHSQKLSDALNEIGRLVHTTLDTGEVMQRALAAAAGAMGANTGAIVSYDDDDNATVLYIYPPDGAPFFIGQVFTPEEAPFTRVVRSSREALMIGDTSEVEIFNPEEHPKYGGGAVILLPLVMRDEICAGIGLNFTETQVFTEADRDFAGKLAATISSALENARLFEEREKAIEALAEKDQAVRKAYRDVIDAVTGGHLVICDRDEMNKEIAEEGEPLCEVDTPGQLADVRRDLTRRLDGVPDAKGLVLASSEALTNALKHAGRGWYGVRRDPDRVCVIVVDHGPGIDFSNLPKATLLPGYSTEQTLGMGFTLMIQLTDRLLLCTGARGTRLALERRFSKSGDRPKASLGS